MTDHAARQAKLYGDIWNDDPRYGTAERDVRDTVAHRIAPHMQRLFGERFVDVADFGAGDGRFLFEMHYVGLISAGIGVDFHAPLGLPGWLDWYRQPLWTPIPVVVDYAISTDALEHLPPEMVPAALSAIAGAALHGFLRISLKEDRYGTDRGLHLHESVFPSWEWRSLLDRAGIAVTSYRVYADVSPEFGSREAALEVWY